MLMLQVIRGVVTFPILIGAAIAVVIGVLRSDAVPERSAPSDLHLSRGATGQIVTMPKFSARGVQADIHVEEVFYEGGRQVPVSFNALVWITDDMEVAVGDQVDLEWTATPLDQLPPGYARYVGSRGAVASGTAWGVSVEQRNASLFRSLARVQERLTEGLRLAIPGDAGSLAAGIVTGNDASLSDTARDAFLRTGTTHITAVSGSNVAMVLALWNVAISSNRTRRVLIVQVTIVITIWLYAILVGLEPSAVRAAIVASLGMFPGRFGRRADPLTILMLTIGAMALWNPNYVRMIGFWLSVVASFAIVSRMPQSGRVTFWSAITGIAQGVLLAQVATLPLVLLTFGTWSISSILANLVIQPAMTVAFPVTFIVALVVLSVPSLAPVIAWIPALLLDFVLAVVHRLSPLVSPVHIGPAGVTGLIGIGVPSALIMMLASQDARRWVCAFNERWPMSARTITVMLLVPAIGIAIGVITHSVR